MLILNNNCVLGPPVLDIGLAMTKNVFNTSVLSSRRNSGELPELEFELP